MSCFSNTFHSQPLIQSILHKLFLQHLPSSITNNGAPTILLETKEPLITHVNGITMIGQCTVAPMSMSGSDTTTPERHKGRFQSSPSQQYHLLYKFNGHYNTATDGIKTALLSKFLFSPDQAVM